MSEGMGAFSIKKTKKSTEQNGQEKFITQIRVIKNKRIVLVKNVPENLTLTILDLCTAFLSNYITENEFKDRVELLIQESKDSKNRSKSMNFYYYAVENKATKQRMARMRDSGKDFEIDLKLGKIVGFELLMLTKYPDINENILSAYCQYAERKITKEELEEKIKKIISDKN